MPDRRSVITAAGAAIFIREPVAMADDSPPTYFVLFHHPGPKWDPGKGFQDQPGVIHHVHYMAGFFGRGELVMGGPFLDNSGGMMVFNVADIEAARAIAQADPEVKSGLLSVTVKPWMAAFHREG
jgi:uncharacterized protein YciI